MTTDFEKVLDESDRIWGPRQKRLREETYEHLDQLQRKSRRDALPAIVVTVAAVFLLIGGMVGLVIWLPNPAHDRFMASCQQDHKEYECTFLWRVSSSRSSDDTAALATATALLGASIATGRR